METSSVLDDLLGRIAKSAPPAAWTTPSDLARMSVESMLQGDNPVRVLNSHGSIHLTGAGVDDHQAALAATSSVMAAFQRLIDATGASLRGIMTARGKLPAEITNLTRLNLSASPLPGSVELSITPATPAVDEIPDDAPFPGMGTTEDQLADEAVLLALDLIETGVKAEPVADTFAETVREKGPRVAVSLKSLADALSDGAFDVDLGWEQPGRPTRRVHSAEADSSRISSLISGRDLDDEETTLRGTVVRVAKESTALVLEDSSGDLLPIKRGELTPEDLRPFHVDDRVAVRVIEKAGVATDGSHTSRYTAVSIESLD